MIDKKELGKSGRYVIWQRREIDIPVVVKINIKCKYRLDHPLRTFRKKSVIFKDQWNRQTLKSLTAMRDANEKCLLDQKT